MRPLHLLASIVPAGAVITILTGLGGGNPFTDDDYTEDFGLEQCNTFVPESRNDYFPMEPGNWWRYEGWEDGDFCEMVLTITDETRTIIFGSNGQRMMAITRVVEEREWVNGEIAEITNNYFATCSRSNDLYYFGEDVEIYEDGEIVDDKGAWIVGENGAQPGLFMPGMFLLGARYYQERAPGQSLDRAENVAMHQTVVTPAGRFDDCIITMETTPIEPDEETINVYAPGVGPIVDATLRLVEYGTR